MWKLTVFVFGIVILTGCTEEIDFELNESLPRIVIDARVTTEKKQHFIYVEKTSSYYSTEEGEKISGAVVTIKEGVTNTVFSEVEPGVYASDTAFALEAGKGYTCEISFNGETYVAIDTVREVAIINGIFAVQLFDTIPILNEIDSSYSILLFTQETPGLGDYYLWYYYINNSLFSDTLSEYSFTDDAFIDGAFVPGLPIYLIDQNDVESGDTIRLEQLSISREYNDMIFATLLQTEFRGGLFDGPPANVPSNFNNGALGFFVASDISSAETVVF